MTSSDQFDRGDVVTRKRTPWVTTAIFGLTAILLVGVIVAGATYFSTSRRLDRTMRPFSNARVDLMREHEKSLEDHNIPGAQYIHWLASQLALQATFAGAAELSPENPLEVRGELRKQVIDAVVRVHNRANREIDPTFDETAPHSWQPGALWEDMRNGKGSKSPDEWDKIDAELRERLSRRNYRALVAVQERYKIREFFCEPVFPR
jgi:hypothetical protein